MTAKPNRKRIKELEKRIKRLEADMKDLENMQRVQHHNMYDRVILNESIMNHSLHYLQSLVPNCIVQKAAAHQMIRDKNEIEDLLLYGYSLQLKKTDWMNV